MKKNVMLSLLAMSSAPVMMYANADITTQIDEKNYCCPIKLNKEKNTLLDC